MHLFDDDENDKFSATVSRHARRRVRVTGTVWHYSHVAYDHQERHRDLVWRGTDSLVDFDGSVFRSIFVLKIIKTKL
jgi:hypothetical protein